LVPCLRCIFFWDAHLQDQDHVTLYLYSLYTCRAYSPRQSTRLDRSFEDRITSAQHAPLTFPPSSANTFHTKMSGPPNAVASSSRSEKKHKSKSKDEERKDKGKSKDKSEKTGPFEHRTSRLRLSIPPRYGADYMAGVKDILNGMLMR
jgi:hypothetical protein